MHLIYLLGPNLNSAHNSRAACSLFFMIFFCTKPIWCPAQRVWPLRPTSPARPADSSPSSSQAATATTPGRSRPPLPTPLSFAQEDKMSCALTPSSTITVTVNHPLVVPLPSQNRRLEVPPPAAASKPFSSLPPQSIKGCLRLPTPPPHSELPLASPLCFPTVMASSLSPRCHHSP
jgi:hypothetical protein